VAFFPIVSILSIVKGTKRLKSGWPW